MQIPVVVEKVKGVGYRARSGEPMVESAEGPTPDEALHKLREALTARVVAGAWLMQLDIPAADNPWLRVAGMLADEDDESFEEFQRAIAENRRRVDAEDAEPDLP